MDVQNTKNSHQTAPPVRRVSSDVPKLVAAAPKDEAKPASAEQLKQAANDINQALRQSNQSLEFAFSVDTETKKPIIKVMDTHTGEVIRQMPSEEMMAISRSIDEFQQAHLLKLKA
jgi:flagellar protein FlaG